MPSDNSGIARVMWDKSHAEPGWVRKMQNAWIQRIRLARREHLQSVAASQSHTRNSSQHPRATQIRLHELCSLHPIMKAADRRVLDFVPSRGSHPSTSMIATKRVIDTFGGQTGARKSGWTCQCSSLESSPHRSPSMRCLATASSTRCARHGKIPSSLN